jgi:hypothetical protein
MVWATKNAFICLGYQTEMGLITLFGLPAYEIRLHQPRLQTVNAMQRISPATEHELAKHDSW